MSDQIAKGQESEKKADKKLNGWSFLGSKFEDAGVSKNRIGNRNRTNNRKNRNRKNRNRDNNRKNRNRKNRTETVTITAKTATATETATVPQNRNRTAKFMDSKHEAASAFADAAHSYKKTNIKRSVCARYCKEITELYEQEQDLENAIAYYDKAACWIDN
ncbi:hypothetical protein LXL04_039931 [Taraxacum kok-saghyz]